MGKHLEQRMDDSFRAFKFADHKGIKVAGRVFDIPVSFVFQIL